MKLEVRSPDSEISPRALRRFEEVAGEVFGRFTSEIKGLTVAVRDVNGPRGGTDKRCLLELRHAQGQLLLTRFGEDLEQTVLNGIRDISQAYRRRVKSRAGWKSAPAALLACVLAGCASGGMDIGSDVSPSLANASVRTYRLLEHEVGREPKLDDQIEVVLRRELEERGFSENLVEPRYVVNYKILLSETLGNAASGDANSALAFAADMGMAEQNSAGAPSVTKILVVTLQEAESLELVWVGWSRTQTTSAGAGGSVGNTAELIMTRLPPEVGN